MQLAASINEILKWENFRSTKRAPVHDQVSHCVPHKCFRSQRERIVRTHGGGSGSGSKKAHKRPVNPPTLTLDKWIHLEIRDFANTQQSKFIKCAAAGLHHYITFVH